MDKELVHSGQSYFNKVVECTGDIDNAFLFLKANQKGFNDAPVIGEKLNKTTVTDWDVVDFFTANNRPATYKKSVSNATVLNYLIPAGELPYSL